MSLRRNTLWNLVGSGLPLLAAAVAIPYTLQQLGSEAFGVLTLVWTLIGYFSLFDFGVGRALTVEVSRRVGEGGPLALGSVLRAGLFLTGLAGLLGVAVVAALAQPLATQWLSISAPWQHQATLAFWITAVGVWPTTVTSGLRGALEGLNRFGASNVARMVMGIWMFGAPAVAIYWHGPDLAAIAVYLVVGRCLVLAGLLWPLAGYWRSGDKGVDRDDFSKLGVYGAWVSVTGVVGPLMVYGDRFFVSAAVGAESLPLYAIPQEGLLRLLLISGALMAALLPRLAAVDEQEAARQYRRILGRMAAVMGLLCGAAGIVAYPVMQVWISPTFATQAMPIVAILCVGVWVNSLASLPFTLLQARGNPRLTAMLHLAELGVYLVVLWWATGQWGLIGAAVAWVARVVLDAVLLQIAVRRLYGV